ncbi:hypothetical protein [Bacillus cereus]|uniref:hypothetical protein n=1 Tax=Bacillus cereus TaxID=1396 RepID=UPI000BF3DD79|nr:hypothetical protein [Bacillus cereus]PEU03187.1 hypothetical protein CN534_05050 [Bacillus cereus]PEZ62089.1 hypothetical protein CN370_09405 [Bacillus cereus]PFB67157.1 hypothetical protein CN292_21235 [Bacillus cereus]
MDVSNMKQVSVKVTIENYDGSTAIFTEKGLKISDTLILSVYEAGVSINKFHYDQTGYIVLGEEILDLQGSVNDYGLNLEEISNMNAIEFLLKIAMLTKDLH